MENRSQVARFVRGIRTYTKERWLSELELLAKDSPLDKLPVVKGMDSTGYISRSRFPLQVRSYLTVSLLQAFRLAAMCSTPSPLEDLVLFRLLPKMADFYKREKKVHQIQLDARSGVSAHRCEGPGTFWIASPEGAIVAFRLEDGEERVQILGPGGYIVESSVFPYSDGPEVAEMASFVRELGRGLDNG